MMYSPVAAMQPVKPRLGIHLIGDLYGCRGDIRYFLDRHCLRTLCLEAVRKAGLTVLGELFHQFGETGGVTGAVVLAESHLAIHTWPEKRYVTLDVYVCNYSQDNRGKAQALFDQLVAVFDPELPRTQCVERE
ncbi:adenosylmethionine decarboxylase [Thermosynechococcus sp.]|uniref:adenosylmethionine decarboxylase n=1 Tax=Thermosynechococcus sp. TaxID=2814275 RepID=UPI00391CCC78